ncbi:MAG: hypothetical protein ACOYWZ_00090 [Bacillota bacterium]
MSNGAVATNIGKQIALHRLGGDASLTEVSVFDIGTGTNTPAATDTTLQIPLSLNKPFLTGYPTYNDIDRRIIIRGQIFSTEANGNTLTEVGVFNNDATKKLFARHVHDGIVKNNLTEIIYELVYECP